MIIAASKEAVSLRLSVGARACVLHGAALTL